MTAPGTTARSHSFVAPEADRLDRLVAGALPELSRAQARRLVEEGNVRVEGVAVTKGSMEVAPGAAIDVKLPVVPHLELLAAEVPLDVLYEDEHTLVIDKAPGLVIHPAAGVEGVTLVDAVRARYPEVREIDDSERPGVVHRLDRDTSGVMVFAKSADAQWMLKEQWREREPSKVYLALAEGRLDPAQGIIEAPLGPDASRPARRAVVDRGQPARSQYRVLEQYGDEAALVWVRIYTGRTHQIRVHLEAIGHPVLGDTMYGRASERIGRQALHAWRLAFMLASTGERREFEAPLPADMQRAIEQLRERHGVEPASAPRSAARSRP